MATVCHVTADEVNEWIKALSERMAATGASALDSRVEHCPDWSVADLLMHIGDVQWFWSEVVGRRARTRDEVVRDREHLQRGAPIDWFRSQSLRLVHALHEARDDESVWTWWEPSQNVGFVRRRQLIEVAVHGWDAENAAGRVEPIPLPVAAIGVTEFAEVMSLDLRQGTDPSPVRVVSLDADIDVTLFPAPGRAVLVLEASASELILTLWGRRAILDPHIAESLASVDLS